MCFSTYPLARVVGRDIGITSTTKLEVPDTLLLGREVLVLLLFPILRKVPVVFVRLLFVLEPLGVVRELQERGATSVYRGAMSEMRRNETWEGRQERDGMGWREKMTHEIPSAHTAVLSGGVLLVLRLLERLVLGEFLVHPRLFPLCERLRRDGGKICA